MLEFFIFQSHLQLFFNVTGMCINLNIFNIPEPASMNNFVILTYVYVTDVCTNFIYTGLM